MRERVAAWVDRNRTIVGFVLTTVVAVTAAWAFAQGLSAGVEGDICGQVVAVYV